MKFALSRIAVIIYFDQKYIHKTGKRYPDNRTCNEIEYVIIEG